MCACVHVQSVCVCVSIECLKILRCVLDIIGAVLLLTQCVNVNLCSVSKNSITLKTGYTVYFLKLQAGGPSITRHLQHQLLMKGGTVVLDSHTWSQMGTDKFIGV